MCDATPRPGIHPRPARPDAARVASEEGNALVLMPVAVLIMFVLAFIAIDSALTFSAQRQVNDIASGIANDAATAIVDDVFYGEGRVAIDPQQARSRADDALALRTDADDLRVTCQTAVAADGASVTVTCNGVADQIFGEIPWIGVGSREVAASVTARPVQQ